MAALRTALVSAPCVFLIGALYGCGSNGPSDVDPSDAEEQSTCSAFMQGIDCAGGDISNMTANSPEECCEFCSETKGCKAFTHVSGNCFLKDSCEQMHMDWINLKNLTSATMPTVKVGRGWYEIDGYQCGGQKDTVVLFPQGKGPYNVVVFGHGLWGEVDGADDWLETIASQGLIVIAPFAGRSERGATCGYTFADDMLHALRATKAGGAALHPAFAKADWSRTGLLGHSRGAKCAPLAASKASADLKVSAMVLSSDVPEEMPPKAPVPSMFVTGTDDKFNKGGLMKTFVDGYDAPAKVYANLKGAPHMEILHGKRLNKFMAQFLSCHVGARNEDCEVIYGDGEGSLCRAYEYEECIADRKVDETVVL